MAERQTDERIHERGTGTALKRRGILAAAGAAVAGLVAKQTAQPVAAVSFVVLGNGFNDATNTEVDSTTIIVSSFLRPAIWGVNNSSGAGVGGYSPGGAGVTGEGSTGVSGSGTVYGVRGSIPSTAPGGSAAAVYANCQGTGSGNVGVSAIISSPNSTGVSVLAGGTNNTGVSANAHGGTGVYGETDGAAPAKGVYGKATSGYGVYGQAGAGGTGVFGLATTAIGVQGQSDSGTAVYGASNTGYALSGDGALGCYGNGTTYGVYGQGFTAGVTGVGLNPTSPGVTGIAIDGIGVSGTSTTGNGVFGTTSGTGLVAGLYGTSSTAYGILGNTTAPFYSGLTATTATANCAALAATSTNPAAFAAYFQGFTYVQGDFAVSGNKSAAVMHPDGTRRLLYCVESPEAWFDDYGAGKLVAGKADVKLDAEFMALVHSDDYRVFLTAEGDCNGLYVTAKTPGGFSVRELRAGASSAGFSWRVVAKRKDAPGKRLEKLTVPKFNLPDPDKLPKPPPPNKLPKPSPPKRP